jgi:hypothetical protein
MPTSDVPAFLATGQEILSGHMPSNLKRGPVLGMMQVGVSYIVGGQTPELTAGYLLNALVFPFTIVLFWLVGRKIVGNSAIWPAILAAVNPWTIKLLPDPIAETMMLFLIMLTYYLITKHSKWAYVLGSVASMLRYECAALILAAFVLDFIEYKRTRQRVIRFVCMAAASLPLGFWVLMTLTNWQGQEAGHYFNVFTPEYAKLFKDVSIENRVGIVKHVEMLWQTGFSPLLMAPPDSGQNFSNILSVLSKTLVLAAFCFGSVWSFVKKNWIVPAMLIFLVPYVVLHSRYPYLIARYYQTVFWFVMIIGCYGLVSAWSLAKTYLKIPVPVTIIIQLAAGIMALAWIGQLTPWLDKAASISPVSNSIPAASLLCLTGVVLAFVLIYKNRLAFNSIIISIVMVLMLISNQFMLVSVVQDGQREVEFKTLADWYYANAKQSDKIALYMAGMVKLFVPQQYRDQIVGIPKANDKTGFLETCRQQGIKYVVWASREGFNQKTENYQLSRLDNIDNLNVTNDVGDFKFVRQISSRYGYLNIFELQ